MTNEQIEATDQVEAAATSASRHACAAMLRVTDPDGTWHLEDDLTDLRAHAAAIAVQGYVDGCVTLDTILAMLAAS